MRLLIRNGYILTLNEKDAIYQKGEIFVDGSKIVSVGTELDRCEFNPDQIIDASDKLIVPGFVNADLHASEVITKGLYENCPQSLRIDRITSQLNANNIAMLREIALLAGMKSLESGITAIQDHWRFPAKLAIAGIQTLLEAYRELGIRCMLAVEIYSEHVEDVISAYNEVLSISRQIVIAPAEILLQEKKFVEWLNQLPAETLFHFHFGQTKNNIIRSKGQLFGKTAILEAHQRGIFNHPSNISQAVWVSPEEIALLALDDVTVVHTPMTDLYSGNGVLPLFLLKEAGVKLALGTGPCCGGNLNIFHASQMAASIQRIVQPDFDRWTTVVDILGMLTRGGAKTCFPGIGLGEITPGYQADLLFLDKVNYSFSPLNNPEDQLIFLENGNSVSDVMVNGVFVVRNKRAITVDQEEVRRKISKEFTIIESLREYGRVDSGSKDIYFNEVLSPLSIYRWSDTPVLDSCLDQKYWKKD